MSKKINEVRQFWETNPLWTGESQYKPGTKDFFEEHKQVCINDCFAGKIDRRIFPKYLDKQKILDLGCGPGFWTVEFALRGYKKIIAADLTNKALMLTQKRCKIYGVTTNLTQQNAEELGFKNNCFSHVNCQGVIHHTPNTKACIREIARVLDKNGTAVISVYYRNIFLRAWPLFKWLARLLIKMRVKFIGRGRENIYFVDDVNELVRLFDGKNNPIGKAYTRKEFIQMLKPYFNIQEIYYHYFPARFLPFKIPKILHKFLDRYVGFMIYATVKKKNNL